MNIILMRHGEAVPFAPNDGDRMLTPKGKAEAASTGSQLMKSGWLPESVWCSTRIRARQTAEIAIDAMGLAIKPVVIDGVTPEDDWNVAIEVIERHAQDHSLFVFHQPILTAIVGYLTDGSPNFDVHPRAVPATAYLLKLETFGPESARLIGAYQPK